MRAVIFLLHKGQKCLLLLSSFISAKKTSFYGVCGFEPLNRSKKMVCFDTKYHLILIYTVACNNSFHFKSLVTNYWMIWMKIGILKVHKSIFNTFLTSLLLSLPIKSSSLPLSSRMRTFCFLSQRGTFG